MPYKIFFNKQSYLVLGSFSSLLTRSLAERRGPFTRLLKFCERTAEQEWRFLRHSSGRRRLHEKSSSFRKVHPQISTSSRTVYKERNLLVQRSPPNHEDLFFLSQILSLGGYTPRKTPTCWFRSRTLVRQHGFPHCISCDCLFAILSFYSVVCRVFEPTHNTMYFLIKIKWVLNSTHFIFKVVFDWGKLYEL